MFEIEQFNDLITSVKTATELNNDAIMWAYSYKIQDAMIDAGCANGADDMREFIKDNPVTEVYITHGHEDHCGCTHVLTPGVKIYSGPLTRETLLSPPECTEFFAWVWGQPHPLKHVELLPQEFDIDDLHFQVVDLKGHSREMVGFYEVNNQWFFSADAVPLPSRKTMAMPDENVPQMIATMEKIKDMKISVLFDGHKGPVNNPREYIKVRINNLKDIQRRVKELHGEGFSVEAIQKELKLEAPWYMDLTAGRFRIDVLIESLIRDQVL